MKKILLLTILMAFLCYNAKSQEFEWQKAQKILASDPQAGDEFGISVAIDGDYAVIGAHGEGSSGAAYFFDRNNNGSWTQVARVKASDAQSGDRFGRAVGISGDFAVIGAYGEDEGGSNAGAAYFFERNNGSWTEVARVKASDAEADDEFGWAVGISGDFTVIGAFKEDEGGSNAGAAYFFERNNSGSWTQVARVKASDAGADDEFGRSVGISGTYSVIGAYGEDEEGDNAGAAYFFERNNSGSWTEVARVKASDAGANDYFGKSVAIENDYSIIGAFGEGSSGAAYFFDRNNSGSWTEVAKVKASDPDNGDGFGRTVGISGSYSLVGAADADAVTGSAYFFERNNIGSWTEVVKVKATDPANWDIFGYSVGISGNYSVIGVPLDDDGASAVGAAYFFEFGAVTSKPELYNLSADASGSESATFYVNVASGEATTTYTLDYGTSSGNYSFSYSNTIAGSSATVNVGFEDTENLTSNTQYFVRASATNSVTWTETAEISFWTLDEAVAAHSTTFYQIGQELDKIILEYESLASISADGYIILRSNSAPTGYPENSNTYTVGTTFGNAEIVEIITNSAKTTSTFTGIANEKSYVYTSNSI